MTEQQREYHEQRAREELARAASASDNGAERSHRELAELHLQRAVVPENVLAATRIGPAINPDDEIIGDKRPRLRLVVN